MPHAHLHLPRACPGLSADACPSRYRKIRTIPFKWQETVRHGRFPYLLLLPYAILGGAGDGIQKTNRNPESSPSRLAHYSIRPWPGNLPGLRRAADLLALLAFVCWESWTPMDPGQPSHVDPRAMTGHLPLHMDGPIYKGIGDLLLAKSSLAKRLGYCARYLLSNFWRGFSIRGPWCLPWSGIREALSP